MNNAKFASLQEQIMEYFKDIDDKTFVALVESFVYHSPVGRNVKVSKLIDQFLKDNELTDAYVNYLLDLKKDKGSFFSRSSLSQSDMIEKIKSSLLSACFNRFRKSVTKRDMNKTTGDELKKIKKSVKKLLNPGSPEKLDEAIGELRYITFE